VNVCIRDPHGRTTELTGILVQPNLPNPESIPRRPVPRLRVLEGVLLAIAAVFFALHFVHLTADFPNHSAWMDWSKYTDEGWYGDAAIRHFELGHWAVPGDFNPAAALPVWPVVEGMVFHFTGVSLVAVRALTVCVFGGILAAAYLLLWRWQSAGSAAQPGEANPTPSLAPALSVLLLAVSPFCFVFTRIAILEPMLILLTLLALLAASFVSPRLGADLPQPLSAAGRLRPIASTLALGILLPAMILTKTTALFLFPAIAYVLWAACGYRVRPLLRVGLSAAAIGVGLWSAYFFFAVRPHYLKDYRYLFSANAYTGITAARALDVLQDTLLDGAWIGQILYPLALLSVVLSVLRFRHFRRQPLIVAMLLWAFGYAAFLAYHDNLQPRYYLVVAVPLTLLVALVFEPAWHWLHPTYHATHSEPARPVLSTMAALAIAAVVLTDARETVHFVRHPEYTLVRAVQQLAAVVKSDPDKNPLVLSISGSDISLITGLPSICDDFGTLELADRVEKYRPGWYAAWNQIDDDKMDALSPLYHPVRVAAFPAMDDPLRNLLILYRLDDKVSTPPRPKHRQRIPRPLQTRMGQQPSTTQLEH
jgi:hypothetical protein